MTKSLTKEVYTSDGQERSNGVQPLVTLPTIPYHIDANARVAVLHNLAVALSVSNPIAYSAAYDQNTVTQRLNDIIVAANTAGASPVLKTYVSTDYNSFQSIIGNIIKSLGGSMQPD